MDKLQVFDIDTENFNPFGATSEELLASALDEAGLIKLTTTINEVLAREFCNKFYDKRENYRELTKLGNLLIKNNFITYSQLQNALEYQRKHPDSKIGNSLLELKICTLEDIEACLKIQAEIREDMEEIDISQKRIFEIRERLKKYI